MVNKEDRDRKKKERDQNLDMEKDSRFLIAKLVLPISMGGVVLLALIIIADTLRKGEIEAAKWALAVSLPVIATWAAAIIAYYFTQRSFESASRTVRETVGETVVQLTGIEKLKSIKVTKKMIARRDITALNLTSSKPASKIKLVGDILKLLDESNKNRLPILDENDHPLYIIHRSMIDKYLAHKALAPEVTKLEDLTLEDLLEEDAELRRIFEGTFGIVAEDDTLADAKIKMDKLPQCLDVFVTENGTKNEPITGWLTNLEITESAKV